MAFEVVAESPADFQRWREHQLQPAPEPVTDEQKRGMDLVEYRCGLCHEVRGTTAGAVSAPDLTHLMSRRLIASGTLVNGVGTLGGWIEGAEQLKPGTLMPNQNLTAEQLSDTLAYLETLQ
jgi:cytochrome c oxidase subunit 2